MLFDYVKEDECRLIINLNNTKETSAADQSTNENAVPTTAAVLVDSEYTIAIAVIAVVFECSLLLGVGFGMLENAYVIALNAENIVLSNVIGRAFDSGMMHGVCTFAVGYGLTFFPYVKKRYRYFALGLRILAICYHSIYNILVLSRYVVVGFIMPVLVFVPIVISSRKKSS